MAVTGGEAVSIPPCMSGSASGLQRRRTVAWPIGGGEAVLELYDPVLLQTLTYVRGAPRPVVNSVLRTPDGVVNVRPKSIL